MMTSKKIDTVAIIRSCGSVKIKLIKLIDYLLGSLIARCLKEKTGGTGIPADPGKHILIIRPGGIGDAIFVLPLMKALKLRDPSLWIDILCERRNKEVFESQAELWNRLYCYDEIDNFIKFFRNHYDVVIDTEQWHYLSALVAYFLKSKCTIGFATRPLRSKLFNRRVPYGENDYEIKNFQKLFEPLLEDKRVLRLEGSFRVEEKYRQWAQEAVPSQSVSLFLGGSIAIRRLTSTQALPLIDLLLENKLAVVLLGGNDAVDAAQELAGRFAGRNLFNFTGKAALAQSAALIKQSKFFIGPDSGLLHLACAVGTRVIAIFGAGNANKWAPKTESAIIINRNLLCSPCTSFGYTTPTCKGQFDCIKEITGKIQEACKVMINE